MKEAKIVDNSVILTMEEDETHLKGKGHHFIFIVYFMQSAISQNYYLKKTDEYVKMIIQQETKMCFKIQEEAVMAIQVRDPHRITSEILNGMSIALS